MIRTAAAIMMIFIIAREGLWRIEGASASEASSYQIIVTIATII